MKTKSYKATFFRHNPQFKNGGYVTERKIEAVSLPSARKRAARFPSTVYTAAWSCSTSKWRHKRYDRS